MKYNRTKTERKNRDLAKDTRLEIKEYGTRYRMLLIKGYLLQPINVDCKYYTKKELLNNPKIVWDLVQQYGDENIPFITDDYNLRETCIGTLYLYSYYKVSEHFEEVCFDKLQYLIEAQVCSWGCDKIINFDKNHNLSFSEFVELVEFYKNKDFTNKEYVWLLNVPDWLEQSVSNFFNHHNPQSRRKGNVKDLSTLLDELVFWFNNSYICKQDVINIVELCADNSIDKVSSFIEELKNNIIDLTLLSTLLPVMILKHRKVNSKLIYKRLETQPVWCDDTVWKLFNKSKAYKGAKLVHLIKDALIKAYSPKEYFYVCMARDAVPLYNLLFESGYDSMLGVFSRSQIGDDDSVKLLKNEIDLAINKTNKKPLLIDIQGRGTIYDYLKQEGIMADMIFGVSATPEYSRYPLLINDEELGVEAIKYIEKLPQNNGRAEGVYSRLRCGRGFQDTLIAWGTRDPNVIGVDNNLTDWEILQFRGLFMECIGVHHVHAGMVGNDHQQRMWGILKHNRFEMPTFSVGINVDDYIIKKIKSCRFKTQHEVGNSNGAYDPYMRLKDEERQFGMTGIRTIFGIAEDDSNETHQYGSVFCKVDINKVLPYTTITPEDSLKTAHDHYPLLFCNKLPICEGEYREVQYNTLLTWDCIVEVK